MCRNEIIIGISINIQYNRNIFCAIHNPKSVRFEFKLHPRRLAQYSRQPLIANGRPFHDKYGLFNTRLKLIY
jgi:hypothetical protein